MNTHLNNDASSDPSFASVSQELLNDTSQLQKAFEKAADDATATILSMQPLPSDKNGAIPQPVPSGKNKSDTQPIPSGENKFDALPLPSGESKSGTQPLSSGESKSDTQPLSSAESKFAMQPQEAPAAKSPTVPPDDPVSSWFFTLMCMSIPLVGWIYLIWLAFCKRNTRRRNFARAYLLFKLIFLGISAILLGILIWVSLDVLDRLLAYMQML